MAGKKKAQPARKKTAPKAAVKRVAKPAAKKAKPAAGKTEAKKPAKKAVPAKAAAPKKALEKPPKKTAPAARPKPAPKRRPTAELAEEQRRLQLRRELLSRREKIVREAKAEIAKYIKGENRQLVETALDDGDWSVVDLSEDINLRKLSAHQATLKNIDAALRKLDEGTYGICEECGDEINIERLKVLPFAVYCRDCQEKKEIMEALEREETV